MKYIILSLKHGTPERPCFWRADNCGYTYIPFAAGIYTKEQIDADPFYYNDGRSSVAIPLTDQAMDTLQLTVSYSEKFLDKFLNKTTKGK